MILLGHSYGGTVITDAAAGEEAVAHLVYLTAMIPDTGDLLVSMGAFCRHYRVLDLFNTAWTHRGNQ